MVQARRNLPRVRVYFHLSMKPPFFTMSSKRKLASPTESSSAKRPCRSYIDGDDADEMASGTSTHERPRNHPVYGQRSAFPGLDAAVEDELFYGPAEDGIEYLRMVR